MIWFCLTTLNEVLGHVCMQGLDSLGVWRGFYHLLLSETEYGLIFGMRFPSTVPCRPGYICPLDCQLCISCISPVFTFLHLNMPPCVPSSSWSMHWPVISILCWNHFLITRVPMSVKVDTSYHSLPLYSTFLTGAHALTFTYLMYSFELMLRSDRLFTWTELFIYTSFKMTHNRVLSLEQFESTSNATGLITSTWSLVHTICLFSFSS